VDPGECSMRPENVAGKARRLSSGRPGCVGSDAARQERDESVRDARHEAMGPGVAVFINGAELSPIRSLVGGDDRTRATARDLAWVSL